MKSHQRTHFFLLLIGFILAFLTLEKSASALTSNVRVQCTGTNVNVRSSTVTGSSANIVGTVSSPNQGKVLSGPIGGSGYTWYQIQWDKGITGYVVQDYLQLISASAPAPSLSSISPNPVTGSASAQTFTISGSNFVSGSKVQVGFASNGYTLTNTSTNATFVSSSTLTVPITSKLHRSKWPSDLCECLTGGYLNNHGHGS